MIELTHKRINLQLVHPFRLSRGVSTEKTNIVVSLQWHGVTGIGEAAPHSYFGETPDSIEADLEQVSRHLGDDPYLIDELTHRLRHEMNLSGAALAAIDMALHDLVARSLKIPLYRLLGLSAGPAKPTSFTIAIADPEAMGQRIQEAPEFSVYKVKVGNGSDLETLAALRKTTTQPFRVDANAGWQVEEAIELGKQLAPLGIEFLEQPIAPGNAEDMGRIRSGQPIPVFADESCCTAEDVPPLANQVDGINIKLMKCGGIREALRLVATARACGLKVMLGCMIESSIGITAAAHLISLVDYIDLDGNLLIKNDPFIGARCVNGQLAPAEEIGIGVRSSENNR